MNRLGIFASAKVGGGGAPTSGLINHVAIAAPRNGTTTHTVGPSSGAVVAGTVFTPTAGNLLLCVANGSVTSTTPSTWTLPSGGSAINNSGLYLWYKTAAGGDSFTITHNASNYPELLEFFEYAAGATFLGCAAATNVAVAGGAGPSLGSLTGTYDAYGTLGYAHAGTNAISVNWASGTEILDASAILASSTDGYLCSTTQVLGRTGASWSVAATGVGTFTSTVERLSWAVRP